LSAFFFWRVAPVPVRFPNPAEGAPGPSPLGTGDGSASATVGGVATNYVFNAAGQRVSEWSGTLQLQGKYYWGGKPVAYYANGAAHFEHQDWLGTERMRTAYNGVVEGSFTSLPFGDWQTPAGDETDANHYATLDHDTETDTDHAQFRQYANAQGRWLAPDPYSGSYDMSNPQSMNRYVYAGNNPLAGVDPQGLNVKCSTCTNSPGSTNDPDFSFDPGANGSVWSGAISGFSYSSLTSTWIPGYEVPYEDYVPGHWEYQWTYNNYAFSNMSNFGVAGVQGAVGPVLMAPNNGQTQCTGGGRGLAGNTGLVGRQGGIPGQTVQLGTAAVIPQQFGVSSGTALAPYASSIYGTIGNASFSGVTDVMGGKSPIPGVNVRTAMQQLFPGQLILEIPGAADQGANAAVTIFVPQSLGCPTGTSATGR